MGKAYRYDFFNQILVAFTFVPSMILQAHMSSYQHIYLMCRLAQQRTSEGSLLIYQDDSFMFDWQWHPDYINLSQRYLYLSLNGKSSFAIPKVLPIIAKCPRVIGIHIILQLCFFHVRCLYIWKNNFVGKIMSREKWTSCVWILLLLRNNKIKGVYDLFISFFSFNS